MRENPLFKRDSRRQMTQAPDVKSWFYARFPQACDFSPPLLMVRSRLIEGIAPLGHGKRTETKLKYFFLSFLGRFLNKFSLKSCQEVFLKFFKKNLRNFFPKKFQGFPPPKSFHMSANNSCFLKILKVPIRGGVNESTFCTLVLHGAFQSDPQKLLLLSLSKRVGKCNFLHLSKLMS